MHLMLGQSLTLLFACLHACADVEPSAMPLPTSVVASRPSRERIRVAVRVRPLSDPKHEVSAWVWDTNR